MPKKKDDNNVKTKQLPREVKTLSGVDKEISSLDLNVQIRLLSILNARIAHGLPAGVPTETLMGGAKKYRIVELKIKGKDSVRCFYSIEEPGLLLVATVFLKKTNGQPIDEINLAVSRIKAYKKQQKN